MAIIPKAGEVFCGDDGTVSIVLPDTCDPSAEPTQEELKEYAEWIGIDAEKEPHLMWIAREGLRTPLPEEWRACRTSDGEVYYFNFLTGDSVWDHPMDDVFKKRVEEERARGISNGGKSGDRRAAKAKSKPPSSASGPGGRGEAGHNGAERRRLEKGAAGHVESPAKPLKGAAPLSSALPVARLGRLGALGTPGAAQRVAPDVSGLLTPAATSLFAPPAARLGRSFLLGSTAPGKLTAAKVPDGVKGMEASIRQRIDDEIETCRRAMRLRHQKQIADERAAMECELKKIKEENTRTIAAAEERQAQGIENRVELELGAAQKTLEKHCNEARMRVASLRQTLERERAVMESTFQKRLAEVKEKLHISHTTSTNGQCEALAVHLGAEKLKLSQDYAAQLEAEAQRLAQSREMAVESFQKRLEAERSELKKKLALREEHANKDRENAVREAQRMYEAAVQQATLEAAKALEALRSDYCTKEERLKALKKEATKKFCTMKTNSNDTSGFNLLENKLKEEEERLQKALEEKVAGFMAETQQMLTAMQTGVNSLGQASLDLRENSSDTARLLTATVEEPSRFDVLSQRLERKHAQAMDHIRSEHEATLRRLNLFNPRQSDGYNAKLQERQAAWMKAHPALVLRMPELEPISMLSSRMGEPSTSVPNEEETLRRIDAAVADAKQKKMREDEQRLAEEESVLAEELKRAVEAYRTRRAQEVQTKLVQYREKQAAKHQQRLERTAATIGAEAIGLAAQQTVLSPTGAKTPPLVLHENARDIRLQMNEVSVEEANRREAELQQRLKTRIETLQGELTSAMTDAASVASIAATPAARQRPPPVPVAKLVPGPQEQPRQQLTPRTFKQHQLYESFTPVLNHTPSTIPSAHSLRSSAQASPTKPLSWTNAVNIAPAVSWQESSTAPLRDAQAINTAPSPSLSKDLLFEDRLRRARLLLRERRRKICARRATMERIRELWRQDMEECRCRRDRNCALMLQQIKIALETKAKQINREVTDLKQATVWLREHEATYKRTLGLQGAHTTPDTDATLEGSADVAGSDHMIGLLKKILTRTEVLKTCVTSLGKTTLNSPQRGRRQAHTSRARPHLRGCSRHVDVMSPLSRAAPADVAQWLVEQQLEP